MFEMSKLIFKTLPNKVGGEGGLIAPWTRIYEIFTNGYFILWLFYEWKIRKNYDALKVLN